MSDRYFNYKGNLFLIKNEILEDIKINNKNVVIPDGVKVITKEAFLGGFSVFHRAKHKIEKLWIPSTVTEIERETFAECKKLKSVEILSGLTKIEKNLFRDCKSLSRVVLPDSIRMIESGAFAGCVQLKQIQYASYHVMIHKDAFTECIGIESERVKGWLEHGIKSFSSSELVEENGLEETNITQKEGLEEQYELYQGNQFWIEKGKLKDVLVRTERVIVPESVHVIKREAFLRPDTKAMVKTLILPASVKKIEHLAFAGLDNVTSVEILSRISKLEQGTFRNCIKLEKIVLPASLQRIESRAFEHCIRLKEIIFGSEQIIISKDAFLQCSNLKDEKTKAAIVRGYQCFEQEKKEMEQSVRKGQESLEQVWRIEQQKVEKALREEQLQREQEAIKEQLEAINKDTEFCIRNGVLEWCEIGSEHIILPEGIKEIGANAFSTSEKKECLVCLEIPEGVTRIGERAFFGLTNLCEIVIPSSVCSFGAEALEGTAWIKKQREQDNYVSVNGVLISAFYDSFVMKAELPEDIYRIAPYAFYQNDVRSIVIPNNVKQIDKYAFTEVGVTEITFPNREDVEFCNPVLFRCKNLKELTISEKIGKIDAYFVKDCLSLTMVYLKNPKTSVSKKAFPEYVRFLFDNGKERGISSSMISLKWEELI